MQDDLIYVTGHQHPDTDSVAAAIAYAFFKRCQGIKAVPCRLGPLNNETKYLLSRFDFDEPLLLDDARSRLKDIDMDPPEYITPETTIKDAIHKMDQDDRSSFAVLNSDHTIQGFVSKSDLAALGLGDTASEIELLKNTSVYHIAEAIEGTILYEDPRPHYNGKVSIIALSKDGTKNYDIKDRIVIIGNDEASMKQLMQMEAGMLILVWTDRISDDVLEMAKQCRCPIIRSGHGSINTSRYLYLAPPVRLIMKKPMVFHDRDFVEECGQKMMKTRYRSFPVVNEKGQLTGYIGRYHIMNYHNKKIILVDHNEFSQSVHCIEKAQILEVVDHHRINDFATDQPVSFRNEIVGSTATIITTMFRENQIPIPADLAGLLLGAVLSDTLMFQSPTTTRKDHDAANILAAIADLDIVAFGKEMFTAAASLQNQSIHEMIVQDIKYYEINGNHVMISQAVVSSTAGFQKREKEIQNDMDHLVKQKNLDLLVMAFTSIIDNGSIFFFAGEKAGRCAETFYEKQPLHSLLTGMLSRKSQILPLAAKALED